MSLYIIQQNPFIFAFVFGLFPALIWLWFWLKEDSHPEPVKMITLSFLGGMLAVLCVLPFQKIIHHYWQDMQLVSFTLWAGVEEIMKFAIVWFIALRNKKVTDEPVDDVIYLIVSALGFVTLENALFLWHPLNNGNLIEAVIYGNLRFIGASLLHIMASATIGIMMAFSFYKTKTKRVLYATTGILLAIVLHTTFNLFIINGTQGNILFVFAEVWIGIVVILLLFEKIKHIRKRFTNFNN